MKNCLLIFVAGAMLCAPFGCDRGSDEEPVTYDREVDGPPVAFRTPLPDYDIIGDPEAVRDRRRALEESAEASSDDDESDGEDDPTGPESEASEDEIAAVKEIIEEVLESKDADDPWEAMSFFSEDAATLVQEIVKESKAIQAQALELDESMSTEFGADYPDSVKKKCKAMQTQTIGPPSAADLLGEISVNQLVCKKIGDKIVVTGSDKGTFILSKVDDEWKIGFDKNTREILGVMRGLLKGSAKMQEAMAAGIEDESITADNVEARAEELAEEHVKPFVDKLGSLMMKAMGGADDEDADDEDADDEDADDEDADDEDADDEDADDEDADDEDADDEDADDEDADDEDADDEDAADEDAADEDADDEDDDETMTTDDADDAEATTDAAADEN